MVLAGCKPALSNQLYASHLQGIGKQKKYESSWVQLLNQAGYSVCGIDSRGFGRSAGLFGYVGSYQQWVSDLLQFSQLVKDPTRQSFGTVPLMLLGCSLGANLILHAALQQVGLSDASKSEHQALGAIFTCI
jgi:alpha-beta hydrolase superfamily lysophospholipase